MIRRSAMARVCSGVSACFVIATNLPSMRARKTSPALMCRSDAPRSIAALMIFSIQSVSRVFVDLVPERSARTIARPVVEEQFQCPFPEETRRDSGDMGSHEHIAHSPQRTGLRQRLLFEHVEDRATQCAARQTLDECFLI